VRSALRAWRGIFLERPDEIGEVAQTLAAFAMKARRHGILSLETDAAGAADPFLRKTLNLAIDGVGVQQLRTIMECEIALAEVYAETDAKVWESAGGYAPTAGILGAVMGLIQVMKHLEDIREVGHGIAVAFVATVYGVGAANLFFLPAAQKLRARMQAATLSRDMILEGIAGIVEGLNPAMIRVKLEAYSPHTASRRGAVAIPRAVAGRVRAS
jgi:chemotaxis protein MotA